ncbi:MAG: Signal peptidase-like protein [Cyclobacteriaceae bacterium]|nr:Signal peptidase-like protein [Cyclobacteriaceae bacterium]
MNSFDWLSNMDMPMENQFDIVEVKFKAGRKEFFRNINNLALITGDAVVVDVPNGHHIGYVSMQGELVRLQMKKKKIENNDDIRVIYRVATQKDLDKAFEVKQRESPVLYRTREVIRDLKLNMKLTDVEFQADNSKATFYYSAEERVDFRELIKSLASEFKIRVEMRQISLRQEAGRLGGIGSCGRELCCSTWLTDFKSVSTSAARYQNLSLNPGKLSGQCGRLKCCLNYELETYMDALSDVPKVDKKLKTKKGEAHLVKTDIFRRIMWFSYDGDGNWVNISIDRVKEVQRLNAKGVEPDTLETDKIEIDVSANKNVELERLDKKFGEKKTSKKKKRKPKKKFEGKPSESSKNINIKEQPKGQINNEQSNGPHNNKRPKRVNVKDVDNSNESPNVKANKRPKRKKPNFKSKNPKDDNSSNGNKS